jgi:hypothetical protein
MWKDPSLMGALRGDYLEKSPHQLNAHSALPVCARGCAPLSKTMRSSKQPHYVVLSNWPRLEGDGCLWKGGSIVVSGFRTVREEILNKGTYHVASSKAPSENTGAEAAIMDLVIQEHPPRTEVVTSSQISRTHN